MTPAHLFPSWLVSKPQPPILLKKGRQLLKVYRGTPESIAHPQRVTVNDVELTPARSLQVYNHSPDGFSWGYSGSGPAQLALAILLDYSDNEALAVHLHQDFKSDFVAGWPSDQDWHLTASELEDFLREHREDDKDETRP